LKGERRFAPPRCLYLHSYLFLCGLFCSARLFLCGAYVGLENANTALVGVKMQTTVVFFAIKSVWNGKIPKTSLLFELGYPSFFRHFLIFGKGIKMPKNAVYYD